MPEGFRLARDLTELGCRVRATFDSAFSNEIPHMVECLRGDERLPPRYMAISAKQMARVKRDNSKEYRRDFATPDEDVAHLYVHELGAKDAK